MRAVWGGLMLLQAAAAGAWESDEAVLLSASTSFGAGASEPMLRLEAMHYSEEWNYMLPIAGVGIDTRLRVEPTVLGFGLASQYAVLQNQIEPDDAPVATWLVSRSAMPPSPPERDAICEAAPEVELKSEVATLEDAATP